jgi:hypothetical protein
MALLHWYIVPIAWELGFNEDVVKNFAIFSNVVEFAMTAIPRSQEDLSKLLDKIILFLKDFERLYVGNDISKITRCRLCIFQLIHVPYHISYNGSIRFGSQATCERAIGDIGHSIKSRKSGRWYGKWSSSVYVLETSAIVSLIGIWAYNDHVHILCKHPGLALLTLDECGIVGEDPVE